MPSMAHLASSIAFPAQHSQWHQTQLTPGSISPLPRSALGDSAVSPSLTTPLSRVPGRLSSTLRVLTPLQSLSRMEPRRKLQSGTHCHAAASSAAAAAVELEQRPAEEVDALSKKDDGQFVWEANWYPIGLVEDLDKKIPEAVTILGVPLVIWWDRNGEEGQGQWRVFHDLCPHRLAPLSEGRIHETGDLQCSYHGWTFQGKGNCSMIPQAPKDGPPVNTSPRACARPYPSRQHQGILWVWGQPESEASAALAHSTPLPVFPAADDPTFFRNVGQSDVGYGQEILLENLLDPAHVPFAHHNVNNQGNRKNAMPLDFFVREIHKMGFTADGLQFAKAQFHAPCLITMDATVAMLRQSRIDHKEKEKKLAQARGIEVSSNGAASNDTPLAPMSADEPTKGSAISADEKRIQFAFYCIPRSPGFSRVIFSFAFNFLPPIAKKIPRWFTHLGQMLVLDSDHLLLHTLERRLQEEGGPSKALKIYYTPTKSDALICGYRSWINTKAGGAVKYAPYVDPRLPPLLPKRQLMDRQLNHVRICKSCQKAQKWFEILKTALQVAAFVTLSLLVLQAALKPGHVTAVFCACTIAFSALCAVASAALSKFISKTYFFHDYVHALIP